MLPISHYDIRALQLVAMEMRRVDQQVLNRKVIISEQTFILGMHVHQLYTCTWQQYTPAA